MITQFFLTIRLLRSRSNDFTKEKGSCLRTNNVSVHPLAPPPPPPPMHCQIFSIFFSSGCSIKISEEKPDSLNVSNVCESTGKQLVILLNLKLEQLYNK